MGLGASSRKLMKQSVLMGEELGLYTDSSDPGFSGGTQPSDTGADLARSTASWGLFALAT